MNEDRIIQIFEQFAVTEKAVGAAAFGNGHINDTLLLKCADGKRYVLQRINTSIFKEPEKVMENIVGVTEHLRKRFMENGENPERRVPEFIPVKDGQYGYRDEEGSFWRMYRYIEDTVSLDSIEKPSDFYESGVAFGNFQYLLSDYPADTLHTTIPRFHDTVDRLENLKQAVSRDCCNRAKSVEKEIRFALARENGVSFLLDLQNEGKLPLRVTHNDTKLNNVLLDVKTGKGICVIDLDTVMPGLSAYDFGDSIRFGASTGAEDERDLEKVHMSLELYEAYVKGYLEGCRGSLTKKELEVLPMGAILMTYECGIRFLTDYLEGDVYYKIHRENHNLERCHTQFKLVAEMEEKRAKMERIIWKYT